MQERISFIHAADLHLDSPFRGLAQIPEHIFKEIQASTFVALDHLVQTAIEKQVDFVLLAGDLFDNEKQSLKAQIRLRKAFEELQRHHIHVYVSYGNHDFINGNIHPVTYPENVFIFPNETVSHFTYKKDGRNCAAIYGFSYENRAVDTNKTLEYQVVDQQIPFHIAMLHGSISSNTEHDVYAPFHISDLTERDFDYWALGHIHKRQVLKEDPYIIYPGNIQGRNRKEAGEKGCYHVTLSEADTSVSFVPLQALQFNTLTIDVSDCVDIHQLENKLQTAMKTSAPYTVPQLIQLALTSNTPHLKQWETEKYLDELIELVNETLVHQSKWCYIFRYSVVVNKESTLDTDLYQGEHFVGELIRQFDEVSIQPFMKELFQHKQARKYMEGMSPDEEKGIKNKAEQLLIQELLRNEGE